MKITASAVAWEIEPCHHSDDFFNHLVKTISPIENSNLIVLPELFSLELCAMFPEIEQIEMPRTIAKFTPHALKILADLAQRKNAWIVGGSFFFETTDHQITNQAPIISPNGEIFFQPKNILTQFELVDWGIHPQTGICGIPSYPLLGCAVCYDVEFPESGRALAENNAMIIAVPSFTENEHGFWRVRNSCHARAIENQVFIVHAGLVGSLGAEPVPNTYSSSAIIAPNVMSFPANGILNETPVNKFGVATAVLDLDQLAQSRSSGDVRNWHDRNKSNWAVR